MPKKIDLTSKKIGKLTVMKELDNKDKFGQILWLCKCDCGNFINVTTGELNKYKKSCGCLNKEKASKQALKLIKQFSIRKRNEAKTILLRGWKKCTICKRELPLSKYNKENQSGVILKLRSECKECKSKARKKYNIKKSRNDVDTLSDFYIRNLLARFSDLKVNDFPASLVKAKRQQIKAFRKNRVGIGKKFGKWTVLRDAGRRSGKRKAWLCQHENGHLKELYTDHLQYLKNSHDLTNKYIKKRFSLNSKEIIEAKRQQLILRRELRKCNTMFKG